MNNLSHKRLTNF